MPKLPSEFLFGPVPHQEAIDFISSKPVVSRDVFYQLLPELRARAFLVSGIENANVLQGIRDRIADLPRGESWEVIKSDLVDKLHPYLGDPTDPDNTVAAEKRAELLLRTHGFQAYQTAAYEVGERQADVFPYLKYQTMEDSKVRPTHAALDGVVLPRNHEFWKTHTPPWDWGCRCQAIPISKDDHEDEVKADAKRPADKRNVLDEHAQNELTATRRLVRNGVAHNMSAPSEKGKDGAFTWHPGNLRIPISDLRSRYDAQTFGEFETWARKQPLVDVEHASGAKATVWEWLGGASAPVKPGDPEPPPARLKPVGPSVSASFSKFTLLDKAQKKAVHEAIATVDSVHGDGQLSPIPFDNHVDSPDHDGCYWSLYDAASSIGVSPGASLARTKLTTAHEIGHWLDHIGIASSTKYASEESGGVLSEIMVALSSTRSVRALAALPQSQFRDYLLRAEEQFARAYAQFIATESGDSEISGEILKIRQGLTDLAIDQQWDADDFAPIHEAFKTAFTALGWAKP